MTASVGPVDLHTTEISPRRPRHHAARSSRRGAIARYVILGVFAAGFLMPFYVMITASLQSPANVGIERMWDLPIPIDLSGLATAWSRLAPNFGNSVIAIVPATILTSLIGSLNGYLLSKIKFKFSDVVFVLVIFGMYIPFQAVLVPLVQFLRAIHLYGTLPGLTLVHTIYGLPVGLLIFRNYYAEIPSDLIEAAALDGAGVLATFLRVFLPLSAPGFVVCGIFQFTNQWNDFLFALVVVPNPSSAPLTVALNNLAGTTSVEWNLIMAGALLAAIPTVLVYIVLGRYFIRGLTSGVYK